MSSSRAPTIISIEAGRRWPETAEVNMSKTLQWVIGISVALLALAVAFSLIWPFFAPQAAWGRVSGMMGPGHMAGGWGMMGLPFGLGMAGMLLWPALFIGLIVLGAVWLVRAISRPPAPAGPAPRNNPLCAHCSQPLETGWKACPYCGEKV